MAWSPHPGALPAPRWCGTPGQAGGAACHVSRRDACHVSKACARGAHLCVINGQAAAAQRRCWRREARGHVGVRQRRAVRRGQRGGHARDAARRMLRLRSQRRRPRRVQQLRARRGIGPAQRDRTNARRRSACARQRASKHAKRARAPLLRAGSRLAAPSAAPLSARRSRPRRAPPRGSPPARRTPPRSSCDGTPRGSKQAQSSFIRASDKGAGRLAAHRMRSCASSAASPEAKSRVSP